ncbi:molybdopterin binding domain-containing protein [Histoplasma capsulatum G186AR]|uniref:Molybdopterin binding domain-containing protein n=1 Tax=Ajellomyces capsulatus TaxID=5037 RepID=A0A8H8D8M0_AJECA|nr:molybdopterin binding domain-containing protein [Histoplasma capsulatum]QSS75776.1 molybdopterin binding domain-containing protein [Histoplasma capsulatum G186AR]
MFARVNQLARHLSRPRPNYGHIRAATAARSLWIPLPMTSYTEMALANSKKTIHTAACLIIGDEVLGGKTVDTNSAFFSKFCFSIGVSLKRVEVIADDESEIIEAVRRMSERYDFVVTSGGIGPTHDDITYQSIARAFGLKLKLHEEALARMRSLSKPQQAQRDFDWDTPSPALTARLRMVQIPVDDAIPLKDQAVFLADDLWLPVSVVNGNVYILPGVPTLFERLCNALKPLLKPRLADPMGEGIHRLLFATPLYESTIAPYLTELAARVEPQGVKVGSYPRWGKKRNTVTLVGKDLKFMESLVAEVEKNVEGRRVTREDEDDPPEADVESQSSK